MNVLVRVVNVLNVVVHDRRVVVRDVVIVRHGRDIRDMGVRYVHLLEVFPAHVIRGHIRFTPAEREPRHTGASAK
jgi:hypothetical protein